MSIRRTIVAAALVVAAGAVGGTYGYGIGQLHGYGEGTQDAQGVGICPAEDSCQPDYVGDPDGRGHWVIRASTDGR